MMQDQQAASTAMHPPVRKNAASKGLSPYSLINPANGDETDVVGLLTDIDDDLVFIREVIDRSDLEREDLERIHRRISRLEGRRSDPHLYIAVLGEFASGKSTFINALLREDLLPATPGVTTAHPTMLRHGVALRAYKAPIQKFSEMNTPPDIDTEFGGQEGVKRFIAEEAIRDEDIGDERTFLVVEHPATFLANHIVIIDTPGLNAPTDQHAEITLDVIENQADAAVVVIPADLAMQKTLQEFLKRLKELYLHRCVFAVTRVSRLRSNDRQRVRSKVESTLNRELKLKSPQILFCDPQTVLDRIKGVNESDDDGIDWVAEFDMLESLLIRRLERERALTIAESVLRLTKNTFETLRTFLDGRRQAVQEQEKRLQRELITNLDAFAEEQYDTVRRFAEQHAEETARKFHSAISDLHERGLAAAHGKIHSASSIADLEKYLSENGEVNTQFRSRMAKFRSHVEVIETEYLSVMSAQARSIDAAFGQVYARLERISARSLSMKPVKKIDHTSGSSITLRAQSTLRQSQDGDVKRGLVFAGASAVLAGAVIALPLALPAVALGWMVSKIFKTSLTERKVKASEEAQAVISSYIDDLSSQLDAHVVDLRQTAVWYLKEHIDDHVKHYNQAVRDLCKAQERQAKELVHLRETVSNDMRELCMRLDRLKRQGANLAAAEAASEDESLEGLAHADRAVRSLDSLDSLGARR